MAVAVVAPCKPTARLCVAIPSGVPGDPAIERLRSRASSTTSRSTSPPNSVDAFAGPNRRRDRANTVNSRPPSFVDLNLQRTHSRATARRPTISDERPDDVKSIKTVSAASSAEEDVCFPVEEDFGKTTRFDYEELEEFVAECQERTPIGPALRHKPSVTSQMSKKIFADLRPKSSQTNHKDDIETATLKDVDPAIQEKLAEEGLAHMYNENRKDVPGLSGNRFTFFSSELDDTIHAAELGGLLMPGERFRDLFETPPDGGVFWMDMVNPTEEEVFAICKAFGVHPLTREDICIQEPREKVELFHHRKTTWSRSTSTPSSSRRACSPSPSPRAPTRSTCASASAASATTSTSTPTGSATP
ncbi:hypothetical protein OPT61_g10548 [Boeremia exigua]|uniref:Uncharacterized protein n=1 Tax=Boeremia exigua TaxID=749465 RepID=A0ACC2HQL0_9PLEO|nr:hypothetical protein OPT61_g10548 [Boeremia exigua]